MAADNVAAVIITGKKLRDGGNMDAAVSAFSRAVSLARRLHDQQSETKALILLGQCQTRGFHYRAALASLNQALDLANQLNNPALAASASGNIATVYTQVWDLPLAELAADRSIYYYRRVISPDDHAKVGLPRALENHAYICFYLGRNAEGYRDSAEALKLAETLGDQPLQALILDLQGVTFMREGRIAEADAALKKALSTSERVHDGEGVAFAKEHLSQLELEREHPDFHAALRLVDDASASNSTGFKAHPQYILAHLRAKILLGLGQQRVALAEFLRAATLADIWRLGALPGDATNVLTVANLQEVYADYTQLAAKIALENNDNALAMSALEVLAENRASTLREQLTIVYGENGKLPDQYFYKLSQLQSAQAEVTLGRNANKDRLDLERVRLEISNLENEIGIKLQKSPVFQERIPRRNSLRDIQLTLGKGQVLISIALGRNQSYLWAVTGDRVSLSKLPGESELQSRATLFAAGVRNGVNSTVAMTLSRELFAGLPTDVWNRSEWLVVADGPLLNGIPFCALPNLAGADAGQPMIQDKSLRFLPSELLLLNHRNNEPLEHSFTGIADPVYNLADSRISKNNAADAKTISAGVVLARLAGSDQEIRSAAAESGYKDATLLTGLNATRENLDNVFKGHTGILHFAVHVVSPPNQPQQSALALSLKNGIPELLTPEVVASFHVPGSLVVLSGCSSGLGKVLPGAGLVGLSRAWLLAGAAAVVVSSWPTPDDSGRFFSSFYRHFDQIKFGDTAQRAALALRRTQLAMLHGSGPQTSPAFWGAFAVISKE